MFLNCDSMIGVIGCGNQGTALINGFSHAGHDVIASDCDTEKLASVDVETTTNNQHIADQADVLFIAVKPGTVQTVLESLDVSKDDVVVSVAAALPIKQIRCWTDAQVVRVMPNLAAEVGEMAAAYTCAENVSEAVRSDVADLLDEVGSAIEIEEDQLNAVTGLSGSGPAFVFAFIKALRNAGIDAGIPEEPARTLAAQTVKGSAALVLNDDRDLEEMINAVCSPNGTTVEGMERLQSKEFEAIAAEAVRAAIKRCDEIEAELAEQI